MDLPQPLINLSNVFFMVVFLISFFVVALWLIFVIDYEKFSARA